MHFFYMYVCYRCMNTVNEQLYPTLYTSKIVKAKEGKELWKLFNVK